MLGFASTCVASWEGILTYVSGSSSYLFSPWLMMAVILDSFWLMVAPACYSGGLLLAPVDKLWFIAVSQKWLPCKNVPAMWNMHELANAPPNRSPTAGGQYHWVSEFAPPRWQKQLSYLSGKPRAACSPLAPNAHGFRLAYCHWLAGVPCKCLFHDRHHHSGLDSTERPYLYL